MKPLRSLFFVFAALAACGTAESGGDGGADGSTDGASTDGKKNPCEGLGCASAPGKLTMHAVDAMSMQAIDASFYEGTQKLAPTCIPGDAGDAGACSAWLFESLGIGAHVIQVRATGYVSLDVMVTIQGPAGCCGFGPDVEKTASLTKM